jgi:hypothetical protein
MAISDSQKVDLLYKRYFGVAKTDIGTNKSPSNEAISSPVFVRGDRIWTQSSLIPPIAAPVELVVEEYTGTSSIECSPDTSTTPIGGVYPTWLTNIVDWIPPEFGPTYFVKVYVDNANASNPESTGTQIFDSGTGGIGEWNFDYQAGVLNFIGGTIPTALTAGKAIYVSGYKYSGLAGSGNIPAARIGNIEIKENTIKAANADGDIILQPDGLGQLRYQTSTISQAMPFATDSITMPSFSHGSYMARTTTENNTPSELTFDGLTAGTTNRLVLPNFYAYKVSADIIAKTTTETVTWNIKFLASRGTDASTTTLVGATVTEKIAGNISAASWSISAVADTVNGCVRLLVTGENSKTIRWLAAINTLELYQT